MQSSCCKYLGTTCMMYMYVHQISCIYIMYHVYIYLLASLLVVQVTLVTFGVNIVQCIIYVVHTWYTVMYMYYGNTVQFYSVTSNFTMLTVRQGNTSWRCTYRYMYAHGDEYGFNMIIGSTILKSHILTCIKYMTK